MAALASSAVTIVRAWTEGGTSGKEVTALEVTLVLTAQGTVANPIDASTLGLQKIEQATSFRVSDNTLVVAAPSYDGTKLLLYDVQQATDANRDNPADFTATVRGIVKGYR